MTDILGSLDIGDIYDNVTDTFGNIIDNVFNNTNVHNQLYEPHRYQFLTIFLLFMIFFYVVRALVEHYKPTYGHHTGATIIAGVLWSSIFYWIYGADKGQI